MRPDNSREPDEKFVELLAAYDAAVASGTATPLPLDSKPMHWQERLARAQAVVERLERDRMRRGIGEPPAASPAAEAPGLVYDAEGRLTQLEDYQIMRELGCGGSGTVYLAFDSKNQRQVALKIPRLEVLAVPSLRYRFLREARTASGFSHPNLISVYHTGEIGPLCYMVSAYCPGVSLREWFIRRDDPLPIEQAVTLVTAIASAVGYIHERGVVHRDLKPSNVLLERTAVSVPPPIVDSATRNGVASVVSDLDRDLSSFTPKVTDFGLAKNLELDEGQTRSGTVLGTPRYMAPEQAEGRVRMVGPPSDVYALGVILYELLTRQTPSWEAGDNGPVLVSARKFRSDVSRELDAICHRCLAREPANRYATAGELVTALRAFLSNEVGDNWIGGLWRRAVSRVRTPKQN